MAAAAAAARWATRLAPREWPLTDANQLLWELQDRARACNLVLEVRDARLPLSSASPEIYKHICAWKEHIVVLNKADLADRGSVEDWKQYFLVRKQPHVFVNAHNKESVKEMVKEMKIRLSDAIRLQRTSMVLLMGLPNVGKSVVSNTLHRVGRYNVSALEKLTLAVVGPKPYTTRTISGYKINYCPPMYLLDTPGVMHESIADAEVGLKLALTGAINEETIGVENLAKYLLVLWNHRASLERQKHWIDARRVHEFSKRPMDKFSAKEKRAMGHDDYKVEVKGLLSECLQDFSGRLDDDIDMEHLIENQLQELQDFFQTTTVKAMDVRKTATKLLNLYRVGKLGCFTLDELPQARTDELPQARTDELPQARTDELPQARKDELPQARTDVAQHGVHLGTVQNEVPRGRVRNRTRKLKAPPKAPKREVMIRKARGKLFAGQGKKNVKRNKVPTLWTKIQALNPPTRGDPKTWKRRRKRYHIDFTKISWRPILHNAGIFRRKF